MKNRSRVVRASAVLHLAGWTLAAALTLGSWSSQAWDRIKPVDPSESRLGRSYSELTGDYFNWVVQFSYASSPINESGTVDCTRGQRGRIWFLAGNFGGTSHRICTIPDGKALFFPIANVLFWAPEDGASVDELRRKANAGINPFTVLKVEIDGEVIADPFAYRAQSPPGGFALRFGELLSDFGFAPEPDPRNPAVADGYWILLSPLRRGEHEIHFHATEPTAGFDLDVTYRITVGSTEHR
jgi:hypothetical protein